MTNSKKAVLIYCDGSSQVGFGHIRRSLSLLEYLREDGIDCFIRSISEEGQQYLPRQIFFQEAHIGLVVFDVPYTLNEQVVEQQIKGRKVICLDCPSIQAPDLSLFIFKHPHQQLIGSYSIGYQYVIIRDEFMLLKAAPFLEDKTVLVSIGGADVKEESQEVSSILLAMGFHVTLVLGPLAKKVYLPEHEHLNIYHSPDNFSQLMNQASWCIVNGGGCLFEALFLKKPCLVLPQTQAEENIALDLLNKTQVLAIGMSSVKGITLPMRQNCQKQINVIDGLGLLRISASIKKILSES